MKWVAFGVFRSSDEFVRAAVAAGLPICKDTKLPAALEDAVNFGAAVAAGLPICKDTKLPAALEDAVKFVNSNSMHVTAKHRLSVLDHWLCRAEELTTEERALHQKLDPALQEVFKEVVSGTKIERALHQKLDPALQEVFKEVVSGTKFRVLRPLCHHLMPVSSLQN